MSLIIFHFKQTFKWQLLITVSNIKANRDNLPYTNSTEQTSLMFALKHNTHTTTVGSLAVHPCPLQTGTTLYTPVHPLVSNTCHACYASPSAAPKRAPPHAVIRWTVHQCTSQYHSQTQLLTQPGLSITLHISNNQTRDVKYRLLVNMSSCSLDKEVLYHLPHSP